MTGAAQPRPLGWHGREDLELAEQPRAQEGHADASPAGPTRQPPLLSRYAHLASVRDAPAQPALDVDSVELPADLGPEEISAVERLPAGSESPPQPAKRRPFWKRIALPRVQGAPAPPTATSLPPVSLEPLIRRMLALEQQIAANQSATELQLERFEENLTRLWELEGQLAQAELRERLAVLEANQEEIADALHAVGRNLTVLVSVVGAALAASFLAVVFLL